MNSLAVYRLGIINGTLRSCPFSYSERTTLNGTLQARFAVYRLDSEQPRSASFSEIDHFSKRRISAQTIRKTANCGEQLRKPERLVYWLAVRRFWRGFVRCLSSRHGAFGLAVYLHWRSLSFRKGVGLTVHRLDPHFTVYENSEIWKIERLKHHNSRSVHRLAPSLRNLSHILYSAHCFRKPA